MTTCHFCGARYDRGINANHWTGTEYVRVDVCSDPACRAQLASKPRRPRRKPQPVIVDAGGWAMVPALNRAMAARGKGQGQ